MSIPYGKGFSFALSNVYFQFLYAWSFVNSRPQKGGWGREKRPSPDSTPQGEESQNLFLLPISMTALQEYSICNFVFLTFFQLIIYM